MPKSISTWTTEQWVEYYESKVKKCEECIVKLEADFELKSTKSSLDIGRFEFHKNELLENLTHLKQKRDYYQEML